MLDETLSVFDKRLASRASRADFPTMFIVGAPRTGSTLLYQAITNRFRLCYVNNLMAHCPRGLISLAHFSKLIYGDRAHGHFSSVHGKTRGAIGPNECGEFWYRWFPREEVHTPKHTLSPEDLAACRSAIQGIASCYREPIVFKNVYCSLRLGPISEMLPEAFILWCKRDPVMSAQSMIFARRRINGNPYEWLSVKPREYRTIESQHYCEQVVAQAFFIERQIQRDIRKYFPESHVKIVQYERFCGDTLATLAEIAEWLRSENVTVRVRNSVPARFPVSRRLSLSAEEADRVLSAVERYFGGAGDYKRVAELSE